MELEDKSWFPALFRKMQTEYIGWVVHITGFYEPLVPLLKTSAAKKKNVVTDFCSGSGEPWVSLSQHPELKNIHITLTDKFPQPPKYLPANCEYRTDPLDVVADKMPQNQMVTFFNSFHHFSPLEKKKIITRLLNNNNSIFIAEILSPGIFTYLKILLTTIPIQFAMVPFVKPFRFGRIFFTWIFPINLFTVAFDGLVSVYRCRYVKNPSALWKDLPDNVLASSGILQGPFGKIYYVCIE